MIDADVQAASSTWMHEAAPDLRVARLQTPDEVLGEVQNLRQRFTHLVIDGPAGLCEVTRSILFVAEIAFIPCGPSVLDLRAAHEAIRVIRQVQSIRKGPPLAVLVPNKLQIQYRLSREFLETTKSLGLRVVGGLRLRQAYADAVGDDAGRRPAASRSPSHVRATPPVVGSGLSWESDRCGRT